MRLAVILMFVGALFWLLPVNLSIEDEFNGVLDLWLILKFISFLVMLGSFIAVVILW